MEERGQEHLNEVNKVRESLKKHDSQSKKKHFYSKGNSNKNHSLNALERVTSLIIQAITLQEFIFSHGSQCLAVDNFSQFFNFSVNNVQIINKSLILFALLSLILI